MLEICGEISKKDGDSIKIIIDKEEYSSKLGSDGEFQMDVDSEHFAESFLKTENALMVGALFVVFLYSGFELVKYLLSARFF